MDEQQLLFALQSPESLWNMPSFLKEYTLHDSGLREVRITPKFGVIVLIGWDLHWNASVPREYDTLALQFKIPYFVNWHQGYWCYSTLDGATSCKIEEAEREKMLRENSMDLGGFGIDEIQPYMFDQSLTRTIFEGMNSSASEVIHSEPMHCVCFHENGDAWYPSQTINQQ